VKSSSLRWIFFPLVHPLLNGKEMKMERNGKKRKIYPRIQRLSVDVDNGFECYRPNSRLVLPQEGYDQQKSSHSLHFCRVKESLLEHHSTLLFPFFSTNLALFLSLARES
jgi:hypothetical protein